mmetsp:Transcript_21731/g.64889  ORF Transcript_21731/g.64889 Transcript_21731/m.64889 type:complete len:230 (-) Transcript_21731:259-948(-)
MYNFVSRVATATVEFGNGGGTAGSFARRPVITPAAPSTRGSISSLKTQQGSSAEAQPVSGPKAVRVKFWENPTGSCRGTRAKKTVFMSGEKVNVRLFDAERSKSRKPVRLAISMVPVAVAQCASPDESERAVRVEPLCVMTTLDSPRRLSWLIHSPDSEVGGDGGDGAGVVLSKKAKDSQLQSWQHSAAQSCTVDPLSIWVHRYEEEDVGSRCMVAGSTETAGGHRSSK